MGDIWATHRQTAEHAEQQAEVIRQLQRLQSDTQQSKLLPRHDATRNMYHGFIRITSLEV